MAKKANKEYRRLTQALGVLGVIILGMIGFLSYPLIFGTTVILETLPVDPFDPLRGQYIIIQYDISSVGVPSGTVVGDQVYVTLTTDESNIATVTGAGKTKPQSGLFIKGTVESFIAGRAQVEYGIEQYFFERNARFSTQDLQVEVKIDNTGQARISRLLTDGEPLEITYQNVSLTS